MSIVVGILDIVEREARQAGAAAIRRVEVEVGALAGVEIPALEFAFAAARRDTLAAAAELVVHEIPGRGECPDCGVTSEIGDFTLTCPSCGEGLLGITGGRELRVRSLDVD